jgi:hypothetical protein
MPPSADAVEIRKNQTPQERAMALPPDSRLHYAGKNCQQDFAQFNDSKLSEDNGFLEISAVLCSFLPRFPGWISGLPG